MNKQHPILVRRIRLAMHADLLLLTAACAALLEVFGPYAATARAELQMLYDNDVIGEFMIPISGTALITTAFAFCGFASHRSIFVLASLVVAVIVIALAVVPIAEFVLGELPPVYNLRGQHQRFMLTCAAATFLLCLPYRLRGWRYSWRELAAPSAPQHAAKLNFPRSCGA